MGTRRKARECALQLLFQYDIQNNKITDLNLFWSNFNIKEDVRDFTSYLFNGVQNALDHIDSIIETHSNNWKVSRMSRVDRNILRLATFELIHCDDIPPNVSLDEAIEIGKKYGSEDSASFINGILDNILKNYPKKETLH